jgi:tRNA-modifying protein YgfZ
MTETEPDRLPEQRLLASDAALVDPGAWELIVLTGNDRVGFLHRLLTGKVEGVAAGQGGRTMLLTPKGHPVADLMFFVGVDEVRLLAPPGQGTATSAALTRYAVMDDVVTRVLSEQQLLAIHGARAFERVVTAGVFLPPALAQAPLFAHAEAPGPTGPLWAVRTRAFGAEGLWLFGAGPALDEVRVRLAGVGVGTVVPETAEALRILAGEPKFGTEVTADYFPMEVGRTAAIDYTKGCFLGQEPIVRIRDRGHINWRLMGLQFSEAGEVAAGDRVESDNKPKAGRITSVAILPGGRPVALGLVHMSIPAGAEVRVRHGEEGSIRAQVVALPEPA